MRGEAVILIALLLTGCMGSSDPDGPARTTPGAPSADTQRGGTFSEEAPANGSVGPPSLVVGTAWTYEGTEFYNEDTTFTVVVAEARADGYLFAAGAEDDLVYEALWRSRWYGPRDASLARDDGSPILRFPLSEGASWDLFEGLTLTARRADVATPTGTDAGFVIEGSNERVAFHVEYSPRLGAITLYEVTRADGSTRDSLRMTRVAANAPWVWYELGELIVVPNAHEPAAFELAEGFDNLLASAGGHSGSRARVEGPNGASFDASFEGGETWRNAMLPAAPGRWVGAVAGRPFVDGAPELPAEPPVGWAYMHLAPVRWLPGAPGDA